LSFGRSKGIAIEPSRNKSLRVVARLEHSVFVRMCPCGAGTCSKFVCVSFRRRQLEPSLLIDVHQLQLQCRQPTTFARSKRHCHLATPQHCSTRHEPPSITCQTNTALQPPCSSTRTRSLACPSQHSNIMIRQRTTRRCSRWTTSPSAPRRDSLCRTTVRSSISCSRKGTSRSICGQTDPTRDTHRTVIPH